MTAIMQLPLIQLACETATNEDWRDGVAFATAGQIAGYAAPTNTGTGGLSALSVQAGAFLGDYAVKMTSATAFQVYDPDGYILGSGLIGVPFVRSGVSFTVQAGGIGFIAGDQLIAAVFPTPIDLTGIAFFLQLRQSADDATVYLDLSSAAGTIINGGVSGVINLSIDWRVMAKIPPGTYVFDIVAVAEGVERRCVSGTDNHVRGVTRLAA